MIFFPSSGPTQSCLHSSLGEGLIALFLSPPLASPFSYVPGEASVLFLHSREWRPLGFMFFNYTLCRDWRELGRRGLQRQKVGGVCLLVCECPLREPVQVKQEVFVLIWRLWLAVIQTAQGLTWAFEGRAWLRSREEQKVQQRIAECEIRCGGSDKSCLAQDVGEKKRSGEKKGRSGCVIGAGCDFWKDLTWLAWVLATGLRSFIVCVRKIETDRQSLSHCQAVMTVMIVFYCPLNP